MHVKAGSWLVLENCIVLINNQRNFQFLHFSGSKTFETFDLQRPFFSVMMEDGRQVYICEGKIDLKKIKD